jgi:hypothetical protein
MAEELAIAALRAFEESNGLDDAAGFFEFVRTSE